MARALVIALVVDIALCVYLAVGVSLHVPWTNPRVAEENCRYAEVMWRAEADLLDEQITIYSNILGEARRNLSDRLEAAEQRLATIEHAQAECRRVADR